MQAVEQAEKVAQLLYEHADNWTILRPQVQPQSMPWRMRGPAGTQHDLNTHPPVPAHP